MMRPERIFQGISTALAVLAVLTVPAQAALVDKGNTTLDTDTGLEWLDLTASVNRSFFDVSSSFSAGGAFEGYRYATEEELVTFWTNAGIPDIGFDTAANKQPVAALQALIGVTQPISGFGPRSFGFTSFIQGPDARRVSLLIDGESGTGTAFPFSFSRSEDTASPVVGSYLVRPSVVPVPASVLLLVTGLTAVVSLRRRQRWADG